MVPSLSTCIFCQILIHPHFHNLELLIRHHFCEFLGHLSRPVLLPCFKHVATYFLISWLVTQEWVMSHMNKSHMIKSCHICMGHVPQALREHARCKGIQELRELRNELDECVSIKESCPTWRSHVTCEGVCHVWRSHVTCEGGVLLSNGLVDALLSYKCQSVISPSKSGCLSHPSYAWSL